MKSTAVSVGQNVKAGDVLATADSSSAEDALALAQANLAVAQSKYDTDSGGTSTSDREQLQIALTQAQQGVTDATSSRNDTVNQNNIKLSQARASLRQARRSGNQTAISQAQDSLDLLQAQVDAENRQAKQQVETAKLQLQSAQNNFDSGTAPVDQAALAGDKASLLQAQQAVEQRSSRSTRPRSGPTPTASWWRSTSWPVRSHRAPTPSSYRTVEMTVNADVAEADLPSIALNQSANVTVTSTGDQLTGTVSAIAPSASTASGTSVVSYAIMIELPNVPDTVRPGMSAQVAVTTAAARNVLAVPAIALNGAAGNYTVRVLGANGAVEARPVQVGLVTSSLAEIQGGLAEGDTVVTGTTSSLNQTGGNGLAGGGAFPGGGTRFGNGGGGPVVTNP